MELKDYLAVARKRKYIIISFALIGLAAALGFSYLQNPSYRAVTRLMVSDTRPRYSVLSQFNDVYPGNQIAQEVVLTINTVNEILPSTPVLEKASAMVNHKRDVLRFQKSVNSKVLTNTQLIEINATDGDPRMAKKMANAVADSVKAFIRDKEGDNSLFKTEQVQPAELKPRSPVSPKPLRNGILGGLLGLMLGFGAASLLEYMDVSVKSREELSVLLAKPVLGEIPWVPPGRLVNLKQEPSEKAGILEQTRTLRTNIQCLDLDNKVKTMLLTSPDLKAGTTFLSLQLARAYAAAGKQVALVDIDLRKESHHFEETPSEHGVTDVILGTLELADALVETDMELLKYLPSGPLPPNPSEMLDSSGMQLLLSRLVKDFDVVILDTSPIGMFSDPLVLASKVDGVVLVAAAHSTDASSLKAAAGELLRGPNINLMGAVLNKVKHPRRHDSSYHY